MLRPLISVCCILILVGGCGKKTAKEGNTFFTEFENCSAGLVQISEAPFKKESFHHAWSSCAPLVGDGICRAAWDDLPAIYDDEELYDQRLWGLIGACKSQHCQSITAPKPLACSTKKEDWAREKQNQIWSELHTAILLRLFSEPIKVSAEITTAYAALSDTPSPQEFQSLFDRWGAVSTWQLADDSAVDGRNSVYGTTAKFLSALLLRTDAKLVTKVDMRTIPPLPSHEPSNPGISILLTADAFWLRTHDGQVQYIGLCEGRHDTESLTAALCELRGREPFTSGNVLDIAAEGKANYQMLISALDAIQSAGFDADFVSKNSLKVAATTREVRQSDPAAICEQSSQYCSGPSTNIVNKPLPPDTLKKAGIMVVTPTAFKMNGTSIRELKNLGNERSKAHRKISAVLEKQRALFQADTTLSDAQREFLTTHVVLQADKNTSAEFLANLITITNKVGYTNVMFAVATSP